MKRGHDEGGGEQEAAHDPDHHGEHPEVPGGDVDAAPGRLPLPQPPDVGRADPALAAARLTDDGDVRAVHLRRPVDQERTAITVREPRARLHWWLVVDGEVPPSPATRQLGSHLAVELFFSFDLHSMDGRTDGERGHPAIPVPYELRV